MRGFGKFSFKLVLIFLSNLTFAAVMGTVSDFDRAVNRVDLGAAAAGTITKSSGSSTIYGLYIVGFYTTPASCTSNANFIGDNTKVAFIAPAMTISTTTSVTIGQNALYQTIWNILAQDSQATLPGGAGTATGAIIAGLITTDPSTLTPNTALGGGSKRSNSTFIKSSQITGDDATPACIVVTCTNSTQTCSINSSALKIS